MGRLGTAQEIADVVAFLGKLSRLYVKIESRSHGKIVSSRATYVCGAVITVSLLIYFRDYANDKEVDGGHTAQ